MQEITKYSPEEISRIINFEMADDMCSDQRIAILLHKIGVWNSHLDYYTKTKYRLHPPDDHERFLENIQSLITAAKVEISKLKTNSNDNIR
jgi:hypothetical protein